MKNTRASMLFNVVKKVNPVQFQNLINKSIEFGLNNDNYVLLSVKPTNSIDFGVEQKLELELIIEKIQFNCLYKINWTEKMGGYSMKIICNKEFLKNVEFKYRLSRKNKSVSLKSILLEFSKTSSKYSYQIEKTGFV